MVHVYVLVHMCTMVLEYHMVLRVGTHVYHGTTWWYTCVLEYHGTTCVLPLCTRHVYCNARVRTRVPWYWNGPTFHKLAPLASWQVSGPCLCLDASASSYSMPEYLQPKVAAWTSRGWILVRLDGCGATDRRSLSAPHETMMGHLAGELSPGGNKH